MLKQTVKVFCLLSALVLGALPALSQARSSSADLTGTVADPSSLPLRGVTVMTTNLATGLARGAMTDASGVYRIPLLPPGVYEVKIELNGFSTQIKKDVTLTVGQIMTLNFEMAIGDSKEAVVIETDEPLIEPERTHQSSTITQRPINELPINGRNFLDFARLTPGVVEEPPSITSVLIGPLTTSGLSFAGQNGRANSVQIDGVDNNDTSSNGVRPTISQEAVSEFQINRNGYDAEFGRATGGVINNLDSNNNDRPSAVGRNTGLGPMFFSADLRVGRRIRFDADNPAALEFIFDAFNLFNRTNFKEVNGVTGGALFLNQVGLTDVRIVGVPKNTASQLCGFISAFAPRVIQLGAKFNF